jgi:hypothetical protein
VLIAVRGTFAARGFCHGAMAHVEKNQLPMPLEPIQLRVNAKYGRPRLPWTDFGRLTDYLTL